MKSTEPCKCYPAKLAALFIEWRQPTGDGPWQTHSRSGWTIPLEDPETLRFAPIKYCPLCGRSLERRGAPRKEVPLSNQMTPDQMLDALTGNPRVRSRLPAVFKRRLFEIKGKLRNNVPLDEGEHEYLCMVWREYA